VKKSIFLMAFAFFLSAFSSAVFAAGPQSDIRHVQESLKNAGLDPGPIDGIFGSQSMAALRQYQSQHSLPVTGLPNEATLKALGVYTKTQARPSAVALPSGSAPSPTPPELGAKDAVTKQAAVQKPDEPARSVVEQAARQGSSSDAMSPVSSGDWARLVLLSLLIFGGFRLADSLLGLSVGAFLAFLMHEFVGWPWVWSIEIGMSICFVLPTLAAMALKSVSALIGLVLILGVPILLLSRFAFQFGWVAAIVDSLVISILAPRAILWVLGKVGIINIKFYEAIRKYPQPYNIIKTQYPDLAKAVKKAPGILEIIDRHPSLLAEQKDLILKIGQDPSWLKVLIIRDAEKTAEKARERQWLSSNAPRCESASSAITSR